MILVVCGTHHQPFDRLVAAAAALAAEGEEVVVQAGPSRVPTPGAQRLDVVAPAALAALADRAEAIVAHAGPGSLFLAWDRGKVPVVWPRDPARGEHVDDHQLRYAATLGDRAVVVDDAAALRRALIAVRGVVDPTRATDPARGAAFVARLAALADTLVASGPRLRLRLLRALLRRTPRA